MILYRDKVKKLFSQYEGTIKETKDFITIECENLIDHPVFGENADEKWERRKTSKCYVLYGEDLLRSDNETYQVFHIGCGNDYGKATMTTKGTIKNEEVMDRLKRRLEDLCFKKIVHQQLSLF